MDAFKIGAATQSALCADGRRGNCPVNVIAWNLLACLGFAFAAAGCADSWNNTEPGQDVPEFPYEIAVDSLPSRIFSESEALAVSVGLSLVGKHLVVTDRIGDPYLIVLDPGTGNALGAFGKPGQGPGEFIELPSVVKGGGPYTSDGRHVWVINGVPQRPLMMLADLDSFSVLDSINISLNGNIRGGSVVWLGDSLLLGVAYDTIASLLVFDTTGTIVQTIRRDTTGWGRIPAAKRTDAQTARLCTTPDGSRTALTYQWTPRIELFSGTTFTGLARTPHSFEPWIDPHPYTRQPTFSPVSPNVRGAYARCEATDKYVFVSYSGRRQKDFTTHPWDMHYVHVFDWSGRLVRVLRLDHGISTMAVSADNMQLYSVDISSTTMPLRVTSLAGLGL